jgi:hypothetical protein
VRSSKDLPQAIEAKGGSQFGQYAVIGKTESPFEDKDWRRWHTLRFPSSQSDGRRAQSMKTVESFLTAFVRGESPPWPVASDEFVADFLTRSAYHGMQSLVHDRLWRQPDGAQGWPTIVLQACRSAATGQAMWELRHLERLNRVLAQLGKVGVQPVLFKGTALAYGLYPEGVLRTRGDTDLIIPPESRSVVHKALQDINFELGSGVSGDHISYQSSYTWVQVTGGYHTLDIHWRINNSELLSRLFTYEELLAHARPLPKLGPRALAAGPVHALLLACMHRATHKQNPYYVDGVAYYSGDRLIWLYDIHLLLGGLTPAEIDDFVHLARAKGLRAVCLEGIERAQTCFHTLVPPEMLAGLGAPGPAEPPARYLSGGLWLQKWMDFQALGSARNRIRYARELLFPPAAYMRQKYSNAGPGGLGWLYLRRAAGGLSKNLRSRKDVHH